MLESSLLPSQWDSDWNLENVPFGDADFFDSFNLENGFCQFNFDTVSSNSSDIDCFNFDELEGGNLSDAFVSQILGENLQSDNSVEENFSSDSSSCPSNLNKTNVSLSKKKRSACSQPLNTWSSMTSEEKEETLLTISKEACHMGIKRQLDIIRIMAPSVKISAEMKEFTLDVSLLNDTKWKKIQEYFKRHQTNFSKHSSQSVKSRKSSKNSKTIARKFNSVSRTSKKLKKEKTSSETMDFRKAKLKLAKQRRKEEKSGLFVYENVVKLSSFEEENVNVLE